MTDTRPRDWHGRLMEQDADVRFWKRVEKVGDCWLWVGSNSLGYGKFFFKGSMRWAHRWSYERFVAPIGKGLQIDHLCRNRLCVNPEHLEPVTQRINLRRGEGFIGKNARKEECKRGHLFDPQNTYVNPAGSRECRRCVAIRIANRAVVRLESGY